MGTVELISTNALLFRAHIITYGDAADAVLTERIGREIETMWNAPQGRILHNLKPLKLQFSITADWQPDLQPEDILQNTNPMNNYFRIEEFVNGNISFVDALGCNTGFFKKDNLYEGSTTAAHEFGHTLGLAHPTNLDFRGKGIPGIMYPRGTLVDPQFQYDPSVPAGQTGGTMHPMYRKVKAEDIAMLQVSKWQNHFVIGALSNVWHDDHSRFA